MKYKTKVSPIEIDIRLRAVSLRESLENVNKTSITDVFKESAFILILPILLVVLYLLEMLIGMVQFVIVIGLIIYKLLLLVSRHYGQEDTR